MLFQLMDGCYSNLWMKFRGYIYIYIYIYIYALHGGANRVNMVKDAAGIQMEMQNDFSCVVLWGLGTS
jgi:hypothetical protein